jgi:predicted DNA-binding transcriptional regulator YafY
MNQLVRLFEIDRRTRAGQYPSPKALSEEWEVSERLLFLDRNKLRAMGAPIVWNAQRGGWYYRDPMWLLPATRLSEGELLAFFLSIEIARSSGNSGFEAALQSAVAKIAGTLGESISVDLNALRDSTTYSFSPSARVDAETTLRLHRAGAARQKVQMRYYTASRGEWNERVVHP